METWLIWLIIGVVFLVIEMLNAGFGILCLGIGAFLAAIIAACGLGLTWQLLGLVVGTFLSFIFIKPVIKKWLDKNNDKKINLDNMIGREATVIEAIDSGKGRVAIDGTDWKAVSELDAPIEKGRIVTITDRDGNTLYVQ